jgi:hypothetical protein
LQRSVEAVEDFQLRRIRWAIVELERYGAPVRGWQVMRKAGLPSNKLETIKALLDAEPIASREAA